jgi:hypothetical protein
LGLPYRTRYGKRDRREEKARKKTKLVLDFLEEKRRY